MTSFDRFIKFVFDRVVALLGLLVLCLPMLIIAMLVKITMPDGPVFFTQQRVGLHGRLFKIHKFRTMVSNADKIGTAVTVGHDSRITRAGDKLRHLRLDELPQVFDVISGDMSFVGTRPEAVKYVEQYQPEFNATLLMPAGITSEASIRYKDEDGKWVEVADNTPVSMNMWGFTPDYFEYSEAYFKEFLSDPKNMENLKAEFFIPLMVNKLINEGTATVEVLDTTSKWFGVTYAADRDATVARIQQLVDEGVYPNKLF